MIHFEKGKYTMRRERERKFVRAVTLLSLGIMFLMLFPMMMPTLHNGSWSWQRTLYFVPYFLGLLILLCLTRKFMSIALYVLVGMLTVIFYMLSIALFVAR